MNDPTPRNPPPRGGPLERDPRCDVLVARRRMLGEERASDPALPGACSGEPEPWTSEAEAGEAVTLWVCPAHRRYLGDAKIARARNDDLARPD
jgi:hypothetical protein